MFSEFQKRENIPTVNFLKVKFTLWIHKQMAHIDGPHGAEAVGHPGLFRGGFRAFLINTALDYKGKGDQCKLESSYSQQHNLQHHVSVGDSSQF